MHKNKYNVLVLYGGVAPEHEVSIITAIQVMNALLEAGHQVLPVYISKQGTWHKGDNRFLDPYFYKDLQKVSNSGVVTILPANKDIHLLKKGFLGFGAEESGVDVVFPVFHGQNGEDGTIQGLLELTNIPYVGSGVLGGAAGMDKFVTKRLAESLGVRVAKDFLVTKDVNNEKEIHLEARKIGFPLYVKPANLGSSIGVTRVEKLSDLDNALEVAFCYDNRVLLEEAIDFDKEVNISIMGNNPYTLSITEQPVASGKTLSFNDKYLSDSGKSKGMASLKRLIPAPISASQLKTIQDSATKIFGAINGKGLARVDFMIDKKGVVFFNEINTIPGSLAFFLWEKSGFPFSKLVDHLLELAIQSWDQKQQKVSTFESNILEKVGTGGLKGKA
ncbi:hypothetical protein A2572_01150 [Candidatus Collierbacteria bacterium RIFOXYD1_FULL_40_9]|uniref:D-alanine--D-alanine ligase n=1 Tax=Candidatus Collierbacteria bacterium RIFOXYD1_FULL_40_9 TaxID=1817731 RepID=A0A1F5FP43_9BACT|nr:MAG: hypothetical protein A2572_01150 [Candidatus Collierbacteria bacterium RIFOXYD1_FULL_40_9]